MPLLVIRLAAPKVVSAMLRGPAAAAPRERPGARAIDGNARSVITARVPAACFSSAAADAFLTASDDIVLHCQARMPASSSCDGAAEPRASLPAPFSL